MRWHWGVIALIAGALWTGPSQAATWTVNSTSDSGDKITGDGVCSTGGMVDLGAGPEAECTLRAALEEANASPGHDTIQLDPTFPTIDGFVSIAPQSGLPVISDPLTLDGTTAPGYANNDGWATPIVQIDGTFAGPTHGLVVGPGGSGSTLLSIALTSFEGDGIRNLGADGTLIQGCHIGIRNGSMARGNGVDGISLREDADDNVIGAHCRADDGCLGRGNVVSANQGAGIRISDGDANHIAGNRIGTNVAGSDAMGNRMWGVVVLRGTYNEIGDVVSMTPPPPADPFEVAAGNLISGNGNQHTPFNRRFAGVLVSDDAMECGLSYGGDPDACSFNRIRANRIGTDAAGMTALGNRGDGIYIESVWRTTVGGTGLAGNLVSGNGESGIRVAEFGGPMAETRVVGNIVGLDAHLEASLPNGEAGLPEQAGIRVSGGGTLINANIVGGNLQDGIRVESGGVVPMNVVGNVVGTNSRGDDLGNEGAGIIASGYGVQVGVAGQGNTVAFNRKGGIVATDEAWVRSNFVGTDASGIDRRNQMFGILASGARIGGTEPGEGNVIAYNEQVGVLIEPHVLLGSIEGNLIGVLPDGTPGGNFGPGVRIQAESPEEGSQFVGGPPNVDASEIAPHGNWIAYNYGPGISIVNGRMKTLRGNRIQSNQGIGIDLGDDGPTPNDPGDADEGVNEGQNAPEFDPVLTRYDESTGKLTIAYRITSSPLASRYPIMVDFYLSPASPTQGEIYLGSDRYEATSAGELVTVELIPPIGLSVLGWLTATATDDQQSQGGGSSGGNTSEFGVPVAVPESDAWIGLIVGAIAVANRSDRGRRGRRTTGHTDAS
ncbi:MAG: right-handed parallel beta-helix repeat-containing protein [Myxococcota bacterium]